MKYLVTFWHEDKELCTEFKFMNFDAAEHTFKVKVKIELERLGNFSLQLIRLEDKIVLWRFDKFFT